MLRMMIVCVVMLCACGALEAPKGSGSQHTVAVEPAADGGAHMPAQDAGAGSTLPLGRAADGGAVDDRDAQAVAEFVDSAVAIDAAAPVPDAAISQPLIDGGAPVPDAGTDSGAVSADAGHDSGPACECTTGFCCDGCHFRPSSYFCGDTIRSTQCVPWNPGPACTSSGATNGIDEDHWNLFCTGHSTDCTRWGAHTKYVEHVCGAGTVCVDASASQPMAACVPCPG